VSNLAVFENDSLTEIEVFGLNSAFNLSDGHSYLDTEKMYPDVLGNLLGIWRTATNSSIPVMEKTFKQAFAKFYGLKGLEKQNLFSICPTASNSIDVVGAWAYAAKIRVGLIEPTFDNLALLLHRREVDLVSIPEFCFHDINALESQVLVNHLDAIFLVNPNNPTGRVVDRDSLQKIIDLCLKYDLKLILDTSFRFCHTGHLDEYELMQKAGVSFIILEDTGKVWPTLDTKASLLSYSSDIAPLIRQIYEELYLCSSNLSLALITAFIKSTAEKGGLHYLHSLIQSRLETFRATLSDLPVQIANENSDALMSIAWVDISALGLTDMELVNHCAKYELSILPGRYFYWNSHEINGHARVRIALLKSEVGFINSIAVFRTALLDLVSIAQQAKEA
jgi:aspartate/methionine/tyrosine aminotransferase